MNRIIMIWWFRSSCPFSFLPLTFPLLIFSFSSSGCYSLFLFVDDLFLFFLFLFPCPLFLYIISSGILGVSYRLTQGVVKHIIPAVASTNAVVAAACAIEVFKMASSCASKLDNYMVFNDTDGKKEQSCYSTRLLRYERKKGRRERKRFFTLQKDLKQT